MLGNKGGSVEEMAEMLDSERKECEELRKENYDLETTKQQYYELLWAVESKFPNESRHQTALRYIQQAERNSKCGSVAKQHP